ncbi:LOW QUALITY PROTEIN: fatty acid 2-hydroxylase [Apis florea]|uniref:LOW QUALITY PROTEIN: fatty acid 2-hydroxylase n=1 Tax=Apis florea TaxID=7463 RepID=UPI0012FF31D7|nr:LOW QUALITY PROTEIN: fatty acid 2-hydroxylase [Apis florea]
MAKVANSGYDLCKRIVEQIDDKHDNNFIVTYQNHSYDIHDFLSYHPGGKKILSCFKNRSLDKAFKENPHSQAAFHLLEDYILKNEEKYQKYENLIDWDESILGQVSSLGENYWEWVNLPVNRNIRLFKSNLLEILTITPWYIIPLVWIPICIYFFYSGWIQINFNDAELTTLFEILTSYIFGILIWTLFEYVVHRKVFHFKPPNSSKLLITFHFLLHGIHHKTPFDNRRLVFPPVPALLIAILLFHIYKILFPQTFYFIIAGTATGYMSYDLIHYYIHHGAPKAGTYFYLLKRIHNYHHFSHHELGNIELIFVFEILDKFTVKLYSLGFGISSKLWDYVFGTTICLRKLTKPIEW